MVGNAYNPATPYKHWGLQVIPLDLYELYTKLFQKLWIIHRKKTLKRRKRIPVFQGLILLVRINYNLSPAKSCSAMT